jgi:predicted lipoprotein
VQRRLTGRAVRWRGKWIGIASSLAWLPVAAAAQTPAVARDYQSFNVRLVAAQVVPGYEAFALTTAEQAAALERLCSEPGAERLAAARQAFHAAMDAWMAIQHVTWGPVQVAFRRERIYFWPERPGVVDRALADLLARRDPGILEPGALGRQSAAVQGLTALERLLFADDSLAARQRWWWWRRADPYRCNLTLAIGRHLAGVAREVSDEWRTKVLPALAAGGSIYFASPQAATKLLLTDLANLMQIVADLKLQPVLGPSPDQARPDLAESRTSARSARNIVINLETAQRMYAGDGAAPGFGTFVKTLPDGAARDAGIQRDFDDALRKARALPDRLDDAVTHPEQWELAAAAFARAEALRNRLRDEVPPAAGITLGFTSFGD